jgi:hypothetical protein
MGWVIEEARMDWKDRAAQAHEESEAFMERVFWPRLREAEERIRATQVQAFGVALRKLLGEEITVEALEVTVDGVTFAWKRDHDTAPPWDMYHVAMRGACPWCRSPAWSGPIEDLSTVGSLLQAFEPEYRHTCSR